MSTPRHTANTILIVDDNVGARRSIEALLSNEDYRLLLASSGEEALDIAIREQPDLLLLDVMMPEMNGFEVCQAIRLNSSLSEIPIIMITALDDDESLLQGIDSGADDFLPKPINKLELRSRVKGILRLNRYRKLCDERLKFEHVVNHSKFGYLVIDSKNRIQFSNSRANEILKLNAEINSPTDFIELAKRHYNVKPDISLSNLAEKEIDHSIALVQSKSENDEFKWIRASYIKLGSMRQDQTLVRLEDISDSISSFQEKHTFSRMISHKLLTPLNALKAADQFISTSAEQITGGANMKNALELQKRGLDRLEYDIHSILKFLESSSQPHHQSPSTSVGKLIENLEIASAETSIVFSVEIENGVDASRQLKISDYNFEACFREIIENAIKFHRRGAPTLSCRIRNSETSDHIEFLFASDTQALSQRELENAWLPYWQADERETGEVRGMGLGLSLIATYVWTAGGACKIDNLPNDEGVVITLGFP